MDSIPAGHGRRAGRTEERSRLFGMGDDARASELINLKLALATFALQLDAFEMRMGEARFVLRQARGGASVGPKGSPGSDEQAGSASTQASSSQPSV